MKPTWMIRAGSRGVHLDLFESGYVAIGYDVMQDLSQLRGLDEIKRAYISANSSVQDKAGNAGNAAGALEKIVRGIDVGDHVITYDPGQRVYWIGRITGPYEYVPDEGTKVPHRRKVEWMPTRVSRDDLSTAAKNSLGTLLAISQLSPDVWGEFEALIRGEAPKPQPSPDEEPEAADLDEDKRSLQEKARERLKDQIVKLDDSDMEELLAAVLRGMGFRTTVSPTGPDRGVDVLASPDGLGLQEPRIKAEVKHRRRTQMGAPEVRGFIGGLRSGDKGLYLSTGGFSKEARYEAERSPVPVKLLDLDDLALLIETHYEAFDTEGRALLPLTRIYWPAD